MKRLQRQSNLIFEHATTFEKFISICNDGSIKPYNETNKLNNSNSLDMDSIYLSKNSGEGFAADFTNNDKYNIGIYMKVNVDEKNLLPSHDFKEFVFPEEDEDTEKEYWRKSNGDKTYKEDDITWQDSIDINDECRYKGSIPLSNIVNVMFITNNTNYDTLKDKFNKLISLNEAIEIKDKILNMTI